MGFSGYNFLKKKCYRANLKLQLKTILEAEFHCDSIKYMPTIEYKSDDLRENVIETMDSITNAFRNTANKINYKKEKRMMTFSFKSIFQQES